AILIIFIVAAVLTPSPDWVSQVMLGVPMVGLYVLGILAAWLFGGARARGGASADTELAVAPPPHPPGHITRRQGDPRRRAARPPRPPAPPSSPPSLRSLLGAKLIGIER